MSLLDTMLDAAMAASTVINAVYARPILADRKGDGSPVTEADMAAEAIILQKLLPTGIPMLGEESVAAGNIPVLGRRFFVVDPLDGTKEFLKRNGEFTVNIALVEDGYPTLGVVMAPVTGQAWIGGPEGAFTVDTATGARRPIRVAPTGPVNVVASRSHGHAALAGLCERFAVEADVSVGSSLKFCLLAEGKAQLYPRFTPTCEWDTAAGQAVLEAAGGTMLTLDGSRFDYGHAERGFLNPFFVAAADPALGQKAASAMRELVQDALELATSE